MSRYIDGTWLLNFFVDLPDDYTLTIGNLRAVINDAPTAECFTCGMERVKDDKCGSLPTLVYDPEDVPNEVLEANDRLVSLADVCKLIKREWQINPHQWGELARLPSADRPQGEWMYKDDDIFAGEYACSNCNRRAEVDLYGEWVLSNYCPNCGARMKGADDETDRC